MKRLLLLGAAVMLLLGCVGGAAAPSTSGGPAPSAAAPARDRIRVAYAAQSGSVAAAFMAKEAGLFAKYGLEAELQFIASGPTLIQSMVAGEVDFGELAAPSSMVAFLEGADTVWITNGINRPTLLVVTPTEVQRLEDLRGRSVGVTRLGTVTDLFMRFALRGAGLNPGADVQVLQMGGQPETVSGLQVGGIAAGVLSPPAHLQAVALGNMHVLLDLASLGIPWPFSGTATTGARIAANPERMRAYAKAYTEAIHLLQTDQERSLDVLGKYALINDRGIALDTWNLLRPELSMPPMPQREAMDIVAREALIPQSPKARDIPLEAYYDDRFVRELVDNGFVANLTGR